MTDRDKQIRCSTIHIEWTAKADGETIDRMTADWINAIYIDGVRYGVTSIFKEESNGRT
jgi:hypothetical protein